MPLHQIDGLEPQRLLDAVGAIESAGQERIIQILEIGTGYLVLTEPKAQPGAIERRTHTSGRKQ